MLQAYIPKIWVWLGPEASKYVPYSNLIPQDFAIIVYLYDIAKSKYVQGFGGKTRKKETTWQTEA
jgi:hypothetical protein